MRKGFNIRLVLGLGHGGSSSHNWWAIEKVNKMQECTDIKLRMQQSWNYKINANMHEKVNKMNLNDAFYFILFFEI